MYIGKCGNFDCYVSGTSNNSSVIVTGQSGSGKSCRLNQIELREALAGNTVIVIDYSKNHLEKDIFHEIKSDYVNRCTRINAVNDGLGIEILSPLCNSRGEGESYVNLVNSNVRAFSSSQQMGVCQQAILREALDAGIRLKKCKPDLSEEVILRSAFADHKEDAKWQNVYQKLWTVLNCNALRPSLKRLEACSVNIIDLSALDMLSAMVLAEVILSYFWRVAYCESFPKNFGKIIIVLDEFQNCSIKKNSTLRIMLRESRKFGLSLILATQSLGIFSPEELSMLHQTATHLYFRPIDSDITKCAKKIAPLKTDVWREKLARLSRGECIAVGTLEVNGHVIAHPLKLI